MKLQDSQTYEFTSFPASVLAVCSSRNYDLANRGKFLAELGIQPQSFFLPKQVHGDVIAYVDPSEPWDPAIEADGLITDQPRTALGIQTADCIPAFFFDSVQRVIGLAHAGWRGVKADILKKMVFRFQEDFESRPSTLQVAFGPCIRACCYEVGEEFKEHFPKTYQARTPGKGCMDMIAEATAQLISAGVSRPQIFDSNLCTSCQNQRFFSFRKEKTKERILSVLQIR